MVEVSVYRMIHPILMPADKRGVVILFNTDGYMQTHIHVAVKVDGIGP